MVQPGRNHLAKRAIKTSIALVCFMAATFPDSTFSQSSNRQTTSVAGNGNIEFDTAPDSELVGLSTKLVVPPEPAHVGTLFLWPGLQPVPAGTHFLPIDNGVLQSVLTWGPSCAPGKQPVEYSTWWISAQYVNTIGHYTGYKGCHGGPIMAVSAGDTLLINISLFRSLWTQTVLDLQTKKSVSFHIALQDQAQNRAQFLIESDGGPEISYVVFAETTIAFSKPDSANCQPTRIGADDTITVPITIDKGQMCYIEKITLKSPAHPSVSGMPCRQEGAIRSLDAHYPATMTFKNNHGSTIRLYWIDEEGHRKAYGTIDDGKSYTQATYLTNPWVVTDLSDTCLGLYLPTEQPKEVVVR